MKSDFIESDLELYVQRLLVHEFYASGNTYKMLKISPGKEKLLGYDAEIVGLTSFYCQFKTSDFLTRGPLYEQRIKFCTTKHWPKKPFHTFALRPPSDPADKKDPTKWQHNVLHTLWKQNPTRVAYVAPMFHTRLALDLHEPVVAPTECPWVDSPRRRHAPPHFSSTEVEITYPRGRRRFKLPAFDGLISIPPHKPVKDLKHHYCFTDHLDVTFHSDPEFVDTGNTLNAKLVEFIRASVGPDNEKRESSPITLSEVSAMLGLDDDPAGFVEPFLAFGLSRAGIERQALQQGASHAFERNATPLQQRLALAAALKAYFDISTLGLVKFKGR
ncbi:hypothetical protein [Burkholderia sp. 22313]|uniref:hypothetical protein n=1 Tax=Burkholderia sp. 22313 TaxID=3453908 RepID=UPI003F824D01